MGGALERYQTVRGFPSPSPSPQRGGGSRCGRGGVVDILATLLDVGFFAALVRISTPLILATLGELYQRALRRAEPRHRGHHAARRDGRLHRRLFHRLALARRRSRRLSTGARRRPADGVPRRRAWRQPARLRHRHDAARHRARLLSLPADLRAAGLAAQHRGVPARPDPAPLRYPARRAGPLRPGAADLHRAARRAGDGVSPLPHALGPRPPHRRREPARGRCGRRQRLGHAHAGARARRRADGAGRRLSDHLAVQRLHLRRRLRPRLGVGRARRLRPVEPLALRRRRAALRRAGGAAAPPAGAPMSFTCPTRSSSCSPSS